MKPILSQDLDKAQNKTKKGKSKAVENKAQPLPLPQPPNRILDEEFQKKIVENAQLLSQIHDKAGEIEGLLNRIQHLEYKLELSEKAKIELDSKYRETIDRLERERNDAQRKLSEKLKKEETVSWSSSEGCNNKRDGGYDLDLRSSSGFATNHRQQDQSSPFSSPSASRRSSKSTVEIGPPRKAWFGSGQDENNSEDFEYTKLCELEKELNHWKAQYNVVKIKYDELSEKGSGENKIAETNGLEPVEVDNMVRHLLFECLILKHLSIYSHCKILIVMDLYCRLAD